MLERLKEQGTPKRVARAPRIHRNKNSIFARWQSSIKACLEQKKILFQKDFLLINREVKEKRMQNGKGIRKEDMNWRQRLSFQSQFCLWQSMELEDVTQLPWAPHSSLREWRKLCVPLRVIGNVKWVHSYVRAWPWARHTGPAWWTRLPDD